MMAPQSNQDPMLGLHHSFSVIPICHHLSQHNSHTALAVCFEGLLVAQENLGHIPAFPSPLASSLQPLIYLCAGLRLSLAKH